MLVVVITILTTLTTIAAAYARGDDDDGRDGNKQKAEDDSAAAIADCDHNDVEEARFLCIAIAANDVEIEPPEEEESTTLFVCKEVEDPNQEVEPTDFGFTVTSGPNTIRILGFPHPDCIEDPLLVPGEVVPGEYTITEELFGVPEPDAITVEGDSGS